MKTCIGAESVKSARNSTSMRRQPDHLSGGIRGSTSNCPFLPGLHFNCHHLWRYDITVVIAIVVAITVFISFVVAIVFNSTFSMTIFIIINIIITVVIIINLTVFITIIIVVVVIIIFNQVALTTSTSRRCSSRTRPQRMTSTLKVFEVHFWLLILILTQLLDFFRPFVIAA